MRSHYYELGVVDNRAVKECSKSQKEDDSIKEKRSSDCVLYGRVLRPFLTGRPSE